MLNGYSLFGAALARLEGLLASLDNIGDGAASTYAAYQALVIAHIIGRAEQVADLLTAENIMDGSVFLAAVRQGAALDHPLLADRPAGVSYEGYLFPETYRLPAQATPEDMVVRMLDTLEARLPIGWEAMASAQGLTFYELLTVASIVEREAVVPDERPTIASVYLNRLKEGMYLQADPTVQYAMGYLPLGGHLCPRSFSRLRGLKPRTRIVLSD